MTEGGTSVRVGRRAAIGLSVAALVLLASFVVPPLTGWDVDARSDMLGVPPTHGFWQAKVGVGTLPALRASTSQPVSGGTTNEARSTSAATDRPIAARLPTRTDVPPSVMPPSLGAACAHPPARRSDVTVS